jgi:hypothetical protein
MKLRHRNLREIPGKTKLNVKGYVVIETEQYATKAQAHRKL